jgi:hypothetical protein
MPIIKFPKQPKEPPFFKEVREDGYHIFSLKNANNPNYYPDELPNYQGVKLKDLKEDDRITVRVFFKIGSGRNMRVDGGYVDLEIELVENDTVMAVILTDLPEEFSLGAGDSIDLYEDEILYKVGEQEH